MHHGFKLFRRGVHSFSPGVLRFKGSSFSLMHGLFGLFPLLLSFSRGGAAVLEGVGGEDVEPGGIRVEERDLGGFGVGGEDLQGAAVAGLGEPIVEMANEDDGVLRAVLEEFEGVGLREILLVRLIGDAEAFADIVGEGGTERGADHPEEAAREGIAEDETQHGVGVVGLVDAVAVEPLEQAGLEFVLAAEGEGVAVGLRDEELVIALQEDDLAAGLLVPAPLQETPLILGLVAADGDPEVEDVAEEDDADVSGEPGDVTKEPEEVILRRSAGQMCVGDHQPAFGHVRNSLSQKMRSFPCAGKNQLNMILYHEKAKKKVKEFDF